MSENERCSVCDVLLSSLGEDGCDQCGLVYDPLMPDCTDVLDFNQDTADRFEQVPDLESELTDALGNQLSPIWDGDDDLP